MSGKTSRCRTCGSREMDERLDGCADSWHDPPPEPYDPYRMEFADVFRREAGLALAVSNPQAQAKVTGVHEGRLPLSEADHIRLYAICRIKVPSDIRLLYVRAFWAERIDAFEVYFEDGIMVTVFYEEFINGVRWEAVGSWPS